MPITFGSIGDIISLSLLIKDLVKSLDNSRGSSAEYQAVIRELWSLDHALLEVEALVRSCEQTVQLTALTATVNQCADQCRKCVTIFHEQVKKFGKNLYPGGSGSFIRDTASKIKWQVSEKDDFAKFRAEINAHCFSINMLLTTTGITFTKLSGETLQTSLKQSQSSCLRSSATQISELAEIKRHLEENTALIKDTASETKILSSKFDMDYFKNLNTDTLMFMRKIWEVNSLTYEAVLSLQTSIPDQLERCWSQEPATLEDALGRVTPIHLEFLESWEAFEAVLEVRFRDLPGHRKIQQREYALRAKSLKRDIGPFLAFNRCFLPGQRIDMSMIFDDDPGRLSSCPGCHMATSRSENEHDTQVQCPMCQMWYQRVVEIDSSESASTTVQDTQLSTSNSRKRKWVDDEELDDSPAQFRRVRLRQNQHQIRQQYMASLQVEQQPQMQNCNIGHGMPNGGSPAEHLQQPRPPQQHPNQQPQSQNRLGLSPQQTPLAACIQNFYAKTLRELTQRHGNPSAITPQELQTARQIAVQRGTAHFKQQKQQQNLIRQQQQHHIIQMQALGQLPPGMHGQMNGMGAQMSGQ